MQTQIKKRILLSDVAELAGVSITAASSVLHKGRSATVRISQEKSELIRNAAKQLGYRPNLTARSLATGKTGQIGFMLSESVSSGWLNPYYAAYLNGIDNEAQRLGLGLLVNRLPFEKKDSFIFSSIMNQRKIDGLILAGEVDPRVYKNLKDNKIPFIVLNAPQSLKRDEEIPVISMEKVTHITEYAYSNGHRRIIITRDRCGHDSFGESSIRHIMEWAATRGIKLTPCVPDAGMHPNWEPGFKLGKYLFEFWNSAPEKERASLIVTNGVAGELYDSLTEHGFRSPEDLSIMIDNSYDAKNSTSPHFARVECRHEEMGKDAVRALNSLMNGESNPILPSVYPLNFDNADTFRSIN